jgi:glycosyltransferase involved in cell wall biosynthesis
MRVGVIVAARAPVPYLAAAVESVLSQDPPPGEVVVVDHGSEPALEGLPGARLVRIVDGDGGPAVARDAGLQALDCELIALCDADDLWEPGKLRAQLDALASHPEAAVCFGRATVIDAGGRETGERLPELPAGLHRGDALVRALYEGNAIPASSAVVRRDALAAVGGLAVGDPLPAASDWDLWLRLAAAGQSFVCEPVARIRYRRHEGGLTSDVARLAEASLAIHHRHAALVDPETARRLRARDLELLARGRIRERRYADARAALSEARRLSPAAARERALAVALALPGIRGTLGRRSPYR